MSTVDTLIIGGTGSLGKRLIKQLISKEHLAIYSRDEAKHWTIRNELGKYASKCQFVVGDIRDKDRLQQTIRKLRPKTIIIAAALKQVDTCELSPLESLKTNLLGTQAVLDAIDAIPFEKHHMRILFVSTDKACAPVNVYGMCKSLSERLITSHDNPQHTYLSTRYGNVLESRGSIIPLFRYQAEHAEQFTVTNPEMTRFVMTLDQSVELIQDCLKYGQSGETWIPQLPSMRIGDLANIFSRRYNKPVAKIDVRPGEKVHEDLISDSEASRSRLVSTSRVDIDTNRYIYRYVISPVRNSTTDGQVSLYSSNLTVMTEYELENLLINFGIFDRSLESFVGRSIEEINK